MLKKEKLENILQKQWAEFIDPILLMKLVSENIRNTKFQVITQQQKPTRQIKFTITSFKLNEADRCFEFWVEFNIPKPDSVVIGTAVCLLSLSGEFQIKEIYGSEFCS